MNFFCCCSATPFRLTATHRKHFMCCRFLCCWYFCVTCVAPSIFIKLSVEPERRKIPLWDLMRIKLFASRLSLIETRSVRVTISDYCVNTSFRQLGSSSNSNCSVCFVKAMIFGKSATFSHQNAKHREHKRKAISTPPPTMKLFSALKGLIIDKKWFSCFRPVGMKPIKNRWL